MPELLRMVYTSCAPSILRRCVGAADGMDESSGRGRFMVWYTHAEQPPDTQQHTRHTVDLETHL